MAPGLDTVKCSGSHVAFDAWAELRSHLVGLIGVACWMGHVDCKLLDSKDRKPKRDKSQTVRVDRRIERLVRK